MNGQTVLNAELKSTNNIFTSVLESRCVKAECNAVVVVSSVELFEQ